MKLKNMWAKDARDKELYDSTHTKSKKQGKLIYGDSKKSVVRVKGIENFLGSTFFLWMVVIGIYTTVKIHHIWRLRSVHFVTVYLLL